MKTPITFTLLCSIFYFLLAKNELKAQCNAQSLPYSENFQSITANNQLPACWLASNLGSSCLTQIGSNNRAAFANTASDAYFISPAIQIAAGYLFTAEIKYRSDSLVTSTWTNLSIYMSTTQSTVGMTLLGALAPGAGNTYSTLIGGSNLTTAGTWYFIVRATTAQTTSLSTLYLDDFRVQYYCSMVPPLTVTVSGCSGLPTPLTLSPSGVSSNSVVLWNTGAQTTSITVTPTTNAVYSRTVSDGVSGCPQNITNFSVLVSASALSVTSIPTIACTGETTTLIASGMDSYAWSNSSIGSTITVSSLSATTVFTVIGTSQHCVVTKTVVINIQPAPAFSITATSTVICPGQSVVLTANGANSYTWSQGGTTASVTVNPLQTTSYTVTASHTLNACTKQLKTTILVDDCAALSEIGNGQTLRLENLNGSIRVNCSSKSVLRLLIYSLEGKLVYSTNTKIDGLEISTAGFASGIYVLQVESSDTRLQKKFVVQEER